MDINFDNLGLDPYRNFLHMPERAGQLFRVDPNNENPNVRDIIRIMVAMIYEDTAQDKEFDRYVVFFKKLNSKWNCLMIDADGSKYRILEINGAPIIAFPQIVSDFNKDLYAVIEEVEPDRYRIID